MIVNATVTAMMVHMDMLLQISALHQISVPHQISALHPLLILMLEIILIMMQGAECSQGTEELVTTTTHWNRSIENWNKMQHIVGDEMKLLYSWVRVTEALHQAGLESSNLIVGIDFTKSNEWTGARSFHHRSLHHLGDSPNPYEQAISIIGRTLSAFDEDNLIPCYGFGDATTHDQDVFSFYEDRACNGFEDVLARYREIVPHVHLSGPTSFAPIIETAIGIVDTSCGRYHVLMIIADGQVLANGPQERSTVDAIVKASNYPLSIVLVGVGDGPWDMMHQFDDNIPSRAFDNFQFVNFTEIMSKYIQPSMKETVFALNALMEIPLQYKATVDLHLLGSQRGTLGTFPLPPPVGSISGTSYAKYIPSSSNDHSNRYMQSSISDHGDEFQYALSPYAEQSSHDRSCPVCLWSKKDLALGCGHQTCCDCGSGLTLCPICRTHITTRIKLYE